MFLRNNILKYYFIFSEITLNETENNEIKIYNWNKVTYHTYNLQKKQVVSTLNKDRQITRF